MNWARIKTIFIILLLFANLIMIAIFYVEKSSDTKLSEAELLEGIEQKMVQEGIDVSQLKEPELELVKTLEIVHEEVDLTKEKAFYSKLGLNPYSSDKKGEYRYANDAGIFKIQRLVTSKGGSLIDAETVKEIAKKYIPPDEGKTSYRFVGCYHLGRDDYDVHYEQLYDGMSVLDGYIRMKMRGKTLISLIKKKVYVSELENKGQPIIPYSHALYRLYVSVEQTDLPIVFDDVSLVYQLKSDVAESGLVSGEAFLYYRFLSEKRGVSYLIKALQ